MRSFIIPLAISMGLGSSLAHFKPGSMRLSPSGPYHPKDSVNILWEVQIPHDGVNIDFSADGGKHWVTVKADFSARNTQAYSFKWGVPDTATDMGMIRLCQKQGSATCKDTDNMNRPSGPAPYVLVSDKFTIAKSTAPQKPSVQALTELFAAKCTDCHNPNGPANRGPSGGLDLETDFYSALINVEAHQDSAGKIGMKRVVPGKPEESLLYLKVSAKTEEFVYGKAMPAAPLGKSWTALSAAEIDLVRSWIAAGAPKSGDINPPTAIKTLDRSRLRQGSRAHLPSFHDFRLDGRKQAVKSSIPNR